MYRYFHCVTFKNRANFHMCLEILHIYIYIYIYIYFPVIKFIRLELTIFPVVENTHLELVDTNIF